MDRVRSQAQREAIGEALGLLPEPIVRRLGRVHFLDCDPIFAGLHADLQPNSTAWGGRSPRTTSHTCYPWHTSDGTTTVVLLGHEEPHIVLHEIAHALDSTLDFRHIAKPVTWYAALNRAEAFAESVTARFLWYGDQDAFASDHASHAFWERLTA